jgi:hypothetical protein
VWPLSANILDPVRVSVVCSEPSHLIQVPTVLPCRDHLHPVVRSVSVDFA